MKVDTTCPLLYLVRRLVFWSSIQYAYSIKANICTAGYAIIIRRKGWEKQGWNKREHRRDVVAFIVFPVDSDQHVHSKEIDATCQSQCKGT
jgi:hypothetical protein